MCLLRTSARGCFTKRFGTMATGALREDTLQTALEMRDCPRTSYGGKLYGKPRVNPYRLQKSNHPYGNGAFPRTGTVGANLREIAGLPCAKTFGDQCALQCLPEGVLSPNSGISASLVRDMPSTHFCEGVFHQMIWEKAVHHYNQNRL